VQGGRKRKPPRSGEIKRFAEQKPVHERNPRERVARQRDTPMGPGRSDADQKGQSHLDYVNGFAALSKRKATTQALNTSHIGAEVRGGELLGERKKNRPPRRDENLRISRAPPGRGKRDAGYPPGATL